MTTDSRLDTETYHRLLPVFYRALGKLTRQGFVVPPDLGLDLIHDFIAEAWPKLMKGFDPEQGSLEAYCFGALVRFARPRIVRMQRWQAQHLGQEIIDSMPGGQTGVSDALRGQVVSVLDAMESPEREVVMDYFATKAVSERALARKHGVTRYGIRELLVQGLARLMTQLHRPPLIKVWDWNVAVESWQNGRTVSEIGSLLGARAREVLQSLARTRR